MAAVIFASASLATWLSILHIPPPPPNPELKFTTSSMNPTQLAFLSNKFFLADSRED